MALNTDKSKVMVNKTNIASANITMDSEPASNTRGTTLSNVGTCNAQIHTQIVTATAAIASLEKPLKDNNSFHTKSMLYKSLAVSILFYAE